uniref:BAG family molecular chaperone regulator 1 n=1 Tax=Panagrolaimus superbus TaxID=310955 RepID=A0A914YGE9_9BILA
MSVVTISVYLGGKPVEFKVSTEPPPDYADASPQPQGSENEKVLQTIGDLREAISEVSDYDGNSMKLIYKGRMLSMDSKEHLSSYHFRTSDKVMGLGKPRQERIEDIGTKELRKYEKEHLSKIEKGYDEIKTDMESLEQNFLNVDMTAEMITRLWKRVLHYNEICEKHMEKIDAIKIFDDDTPENGKQKNREIRRSMIQGIQNYLNLNDKFKFRLEQMKMNLEERK